MKKRMFALALAAMLALSLAACGGDTPASEPASVSSSVTDGGEISAEQTAMIDDYNLMVDDYNAVLGQLEQSDDLMAMEEVTSMVNQVTDSINGVTDILNQGGQLSDEKLVQLQQEMARIQDVVMDGRDIGTAVLPEAPLKIYLTASVETRARRRFLELEAKGSPADLAEIEADIEKRDYQDMHREMSPLRQAEDAVYLDSSDMTVEEVVDEILKLRRQSE